MRRHRWAGQPLEGRGVVVVGATSGVGRATAEEFAAHGCRIMLAARDTGQLDVVAADCRRRGAAWVGWCPTDISSSESVDALAAAAVRDLGHVDVWVNLAATLVAGDVTDCPPEDLRRIVDVNVTGTMLAARAALRIFDDQGAGTLINVSSLLGMLPNPLVPAYCMSKFAIRGLTLALQRSVRPSIAVCLVVPGPIDTPMFSHAANYTGRPIRAIPPASSPWRVAASVVRCARRPRRTVTTGFTGWSLLIAHRLAPSLTEAAVARISAALLLREGHADPTSGSLFEVRPSTSADGGWRRPAWCARLGDRVGRWWAARA